MWMCLTHFLSIDISIYIYVCVCVFIYNCNSVYIYICTHTELCMRTRKKSIMRRSHEVCWVSPPGLGVPELGFILGIQL